MYTWTRDWRQRTAQYVKRANPILLRIVLLYLPFIYFVSIHRSLVDCLRDFRFHCCFVSRMPGKVCRDMPWICLRYWAVLSLTRITDFVSDWWELIFWKENKDFGFRVSKFWDSCFSMTGNKVLLFSSNLVIPNYLLDLLRVCCTFLF